MLKPLPLSTSDWRSRWLVLPIWDMLHRVAEINWGEMPEDDGETLTEEDMLEAGEERIQGMGKMLCGQQGFSCMPGVASRIALVRCPECCRLMQIPDGNGNPYNAGLNETCDIGNEPE